MEAEGKSKRDLATSRINLERSDEVEFWCTQLRCEREDLIRSVMKVGTCAKMVDDFLFLNRLKK